MSIWTVAILALAGFFVLSRLSGGKRSSPETLKARLDAGAQIVDVRSPGEFHSGAYPGARNIPVQELASRVGELDPGRPIVVYCASGARSAAAAGLLKKAGFADVVNAGGLRNMPR
jgi:phage shock protein E